MRCKVRHAFTLVEVLIVVVIMAVLAATVIPQFADTSLDAKKSTSSFNMQSLRSQIEAFKAHHNGATPVSLAILTVKTDKTGAANASGPYGPYLQEVPTEQITASETVIVLTGSSAIAAGDVTAAGGWLYNKTTGEIRINHADYLDL